MLHLGTVERATDFIEERRARIALYAVKAYFYEFMGQEATINFSQDSRDKSFLAD